MDQNVMRERYSASYIGAVKLLVDQMCILSPHSLNISAHGFIMSNVRFMIRYSWGRLWLNIWINNESYSYGIPSFDDLEPQTLRLFNYIKCYTIYQSVITMVNGQRVHSSKQIESIENINDHEVFQKIIDQISVHMAIK